jgi:hypothetical protein
VRAEVAERTEKGIPIVPVEDIEQAAVDEGLPDEQAEALADDYGEAQLEGLKRAIGAIAFIALLSLWFTRGLPGRSRPAPEAAEAVTPAPG